MKLIIKVLKHPSKALKELKYRFLKAVGHSDYKRFIVLSRSRTGSTMLISFLNSHPNIRAEEEIFSKLNGKDYENILKKTFSREPRNIKAKGFKIFYYHPQDDESGAIWEELIKLNDLLVIHLKRRNIFRTLISRKLAVIQNSWIANSSKKLNQDKDKRVSFTVEELEEGFKQTREWERLGDEMFKNHSKISVYYENLVSDPEDTFAKITDFLDLHYVEPKTNLRKQNPENLRDLVTNYDELKSAFSGTEWYSFFED
ncbi:MAG: sulfotransferase [Desulfurivibrionaceae bacterium]